MKERRTELQVAALCNGTAIDHIPSSVVFKVVSLLGLEKLDNPITIGNNLESKKMNTKGIIKIADKFFEEDVINKIALIAPNVVLNIIKDYEVIEKKRVILPHTIKGIVKCNNPKCITNNEPMATHFEVIDHDKIELRCHYCDLKIKKEEIILK
ncbi:aspartate carbamoyltransferase regulatory subunit [Dysgonomonas sp. PFB1-18]|uniref:aspartate carbamoyltransferase regulatory subunit n=1 Tax=unclassified Dysgonomonas TaxID=2630389 RepID=UPI0024731A52|nr:MULTISPECIES: aspartate carbamoyltransferase regulatory subunit [unclassified Dysgonomonas]MDH6308537.1 aspartate carbamoyltransferase regulatory subunit [Dysgonomonas sp. PF1-14]MDH6338038.1 aspartate carbamoyltransferase regulatory subunit [Dysgonomonas sp. PF1-16]MDH6379535.1 aspartate carbamoyltransferase regulatory subunit [Dysgonomonas sp. PFB1-18]MDH6396865.1 aspartate carbamoyltransferase regulatory subunit [Dysgonomonas sp. PF1-23]